VLAENVPGLLSSEAGRFFGRVLRDLAACGYDAEWDCLPASAVGAPHQRDRVWIVAYPHQSGSQRWDGARLPERARQRSTGESGSFQATQGLADADGWEQSLGRIYGRVGQNVGPRLPRTQEWEIEPDVGRVADGIPFRMDRLRSLGNAIVPQVAEWIGRQLMDHHART
jgi:DNA (cytosine-5)-methyltransferase 1